MATSLATPSASPRPRRRSGRKLVGHTCSWTVSEHLDEATFEDLKRFCGASHTDRSATIRRHQLEMAVRRTSRDTDRRLRLVRRDVVDASEEQASELPVVGRVDKQYKLHLGQVPSHPAYQALRRHYRKARGIIHTTVVATIIKRHVQHALAALSLRDHGGTYFVSVKREEALFGLSDFLKQRDIGHITRFGVGGDAEEREELSKEIRRSVGEQIDKIREAFEEADLSSSRSRASLQRKIKKMREEISDMKKLFGFATKTLSKKDDQVRSLMREIIRGMRSVDDGDLFSPSSEPFGGFPRTRRRRIGSKSSGDGAATGSSAPTVDFNA